MDLKLAGKRALVTGSSRGIGVAIAKALAREGVKVVVHGRNTAAAEAVAAEIGADKAAVVIGDISDPEIADRVATQSVAAFGGVDILVNNAGASGPSTWDDTDSEEWVALYRVNVAPAVRLCARLAPPMKARGWGRLIHIGSTAAALGLPLSPVYAASKAALANMSSSLAKHFGGFGITSNILGVGMIANLAEHAGMAAQGAQPASEPQGVDPVYEMIVGLPNGHYNMNPLKRMGRAEEVAYVVTMLASPLSSFVNGALIRVDGGKVPNVGL
jgi:NAD(P)-dependent dehydrogenase (short-subunit alcohol dehydrogenase family)